MREERVDDALGRAVGRPALRPHRRDARRCSCRATAAGHRLSPSGINYRANIDALKQAGVTDLVSVSACGSFKEELYPGLFVLVDQFVDRTVGRESLVLRQRLRRACLDGPSGRAAACSALHRRGREGRGHPDQGGGTYVCMEGPQFSSLRRIADLQGRSATT